MHPAFYLFVVDRSLNTKGFGICSKDEVEAGYESKIWFTWQRSAARASHQTPKPLSKAVKADSPLPELQSCPILGTGTQGLGVNLSSMETDHLRLIQTSRRREW